MDKLFAMRAFVETVQRGSLKEGARALCKSPPTMVRLLAELEEELGVILLRRSTRRMSLTEEGERYLERCRHILAAVREAETGLVAEHGEPRGQLRITAPSLFGQLHVIPAIIEFALRYPAVTIDVLLVDRVVNLVEEGVDAAVRIGPRADSLLTVRTVGYMRRIVVGSPRFLERVGHPKNPSSLAELPCVQVSGSTHRLPWRFEETRADGSRAEFSVRANAKFRVNQPAAAVQACVAGLGFGRFAAYQPAQAIRDGQLIVLFREFECSPIPVSIVHAQLRTVPTRLRVFLDWMTESLKRSLECESPA